MTKTTKLCSWHKCEIGYYYHHTQEEWDMHQMFAKTDVPRYQPAYSEVAISPETVGAMPLNVVQSKTKVWGSWQIFSVVTMVAVWGVIIWSVLR
jgi:hypothetical protein